jgi:hypothetical protein
MAVELRLALEQVLEQAHHRDWHAASRSVLALVAASRSIQTEVDFQVMKSWLDKAKTAA